MLKKIKNIIILLTIITLISNISLTAQAEEIVNNGGLTGVELKDYETPITPLEEDDEIQ
ncbi:MAG: hypothetical protein K2N44_17620 [Lachnospiraceae bacterium]|nr:hypothetical protein [Lachnospiraceae bacterium]